MARAESPHRLRANGWTLSGSQTLAQTVQGTAIKFRATKSETGFAEGSPGVNFVRGLPGSGPDGDHQPVRG
jgi:hypothetical protein